MAPRRPILACLALLAGGAFLLGCGSSGEEPSISEEDAAALDGRLEAIREDAEQEDCTGDSTVFTRLDATRDQIGASDGINEQAKSDLNELLDELEAKIQEDCDAAEDASSTSSSTSTEEDTTSTTTETSTTETEDTTKDTTEETSTTEETTTTPEPDPEPPEPPSGGPPSGVPPSQGGGSPSGGVGPGFESGRKVPG